MAVAVVVAAAFYAIGASAMQIHSNVPNACRCLNWKETFAAGLVECGQGFEFTRALGYPHADYGTAQEWLQVVQNKDTLHDLQSSMGAEFCESFYKRFDDNKCARTAMDSGAEWYGQSWCYVSKQCSSAMAVADAKVSAKLCKAGKDSLLSDMEPNALMAYGRKMGFSSPGYFVKVAYPVNRDYYYDSAPPLQLTLLKLLGKDEHVTWVVDKIDEHQDKMLIASDGKVYDLPNSYDGFTCTEGCDI